MSAERETAECRCGTAHYCGAHGMPATVAPAAEVPAYNHPDALGGVKMRPFVPPERAPAAEVTAEEALAEVRRVCGRTWNSATLERYIAQTADLRARLEAAERERDEARRELAEARSTGYVLAHAYDTDNRPPDSVVARAREWTPSVLARKALEGVA